MSPFSPMLPGDVIPSEMERLVSLYSKTKTLILRAEEMDPDVSSSIAIIKEQRDALDHLMRYIGDHFAEAPKGAKYRTDNLDKAVGHIFRAAFDALDSLNISLKLKISEAMKGHGNDAICAVFPKYYNEYCVALAEINARVVESRNAKDIGSISLGKLNEYIQSMERLLTICQECQQSVPGMIEYKAKQKPEKRMAIASAIGLAVLSAIVGWLLGWAFPPS